MQLFKPIIFITVPFLIFKVVLASSPSSHLTRASFGEPCGGDHGVRCDSRASLSCSTANGLCQCLKPQEMTFSKTKEKCVVLSGERCSYTAVEILTDTTQEKRWTERLECVDNAVCNNEGYCDCQLEYFETSEGNCAPRRGFGENCTRQDECRLDKILQCDETGVCACNKTEAVYDPAYGKCVGRVGTTCSSSRYDHCVRNAYCPRYMHYNALVGVVYENSDLCTCSREFQKSKDGLCLAKHGMSCDVNSAPCTEEFVCVNGKCQCHFPSHQYYNASLTQCISFPSGPCSETINGYSLQFPCDDNAECSESIDYIPSECLCKQGFIESQGRKCLRAHGESCNENGVACDIVANLICSNGRCACQDLETYDEKAGRCKGLVGAKCSNFEYCVEGATCKAFRDEKLGQGICRCKSPAKTDKNRMCTVITDTEVEVPEKNDSEEEVKVNNRNSTFVDASLYLSSSEEKIVVQEIDLSR